MARSLVLRTATVAASALLTVGGWSLLAGTASASPSAQLTVTGVAPDRGIVCPRGQHAYHAPGGAVSCIPNGVLIPTPAPHPAQQ